MIEINGSGTNMTDLVWFVTGCSTGFGREFARQLIGSGAPVVATARDPSKLAEFASTSNAMTLKLDVTDADEIAAAVRQAVARFGQIDVLVNNAGIGYFAAVEEGEDAQIRRMFDINLFGLAAMTRAVLPGMRARRAGFIVNMSSIAFGPAEAQHFWRARDGMLIGYARVPSE